MLASASPIWQIPVFAERVTQSEAIEVYLRLHRLWEGIVSLPPPPAPPFDIETLEPLDHLASPGAPGHGDWEDSQEEAPPAGWWRTGTPAGSEAVWEAPELPLGEGRILVLDGEPAPDDGMPVYRAG
ncbi:MAG TPA: hypothetical protein VMN36_01515 [Verrucomicrobiales bacterium]|nr:hypothetical protein [Verrucomicrobiales bacterium]